MPRFIYILMLAVIFFGVIIYTFFSKETLPPNVYRIAVDEAWYPLQLYNKGQDISAFSEDVLQAIAAEQHLSVQLLQVGTGNLLEGLDLGEYEGALASLILSAGNDEHYISSNPFYLLGPVVVVSTSSKIKSLQDLNGKSVGVITGSNQIGILDPYAKVNYVFYDDSNQLNLIEDVSNQVVDGMILDILPAYEYANSFVYQNRLSIVSNPLTYEGLRLVALNNPGSEKLIEQFNEGLKAIKKNGIYNQLLLKWQLFNTEKK